MDITTTPCSCEDCSFASGDRFATLSCASCNLPLQPSPFVPSPHHPSVSSPHRPFCALPLSSLCPLPLSLSVPSPTIPLCALSHYPSLCPLPTQVFSLLEKIFTVEKKRRKKLAKRDQPSLSLKRVFTREMHSNPIPVSYRVSVRLLPIHSVRLLENFFLFSASSLSIPLPLPMFTYPLTPSPSPSATSSCLPPSTHSSSLVHQRGLVGSLSLGESIAVAVLCFMSSCGI